MCIYLYVYIYIYVYIHYSFSFTFIFLVWRHSPVSVFLFEVQKTDAQHTRDMPNFNPGYSARWLQMWGGDVAWVAEPKTVAQYDHIEIYARQRRAIIFKHLYVYIYISFYVYIYIYVYSYYSLSFTFIFLVWCYSPVSPFFFQSRTRN